MIPVNQQHDYDCMRACIASILEIDPASLPAPHCHEVSPEEWNTVYQCALASMNLWMLNMGPEIAHEFPGYYIGNFKCTWPGAKGKWARHSVVMRAGEIVHDPLPLSALRPAGFRRRALMDLSVLLPLDPTRPLGLVNETRGLNES